MLILRELFLGNRLFDEIQAELGIATNVLSARLATLAKAAPGATRKQLATEARRRAA